MHDRWLMHRIFLVLTHIHTLHTPPLPSALGTFTPSRISWLHFNLWQWAVWAYSFRSAMNKEINDTQHHTYQMSGVSKKQKGFFSVTGCFTVKEFHTGVDPRAGPRGGTGPCWNLIDPLSISFFKINFYAFLKYKMILNEEQFWKYIQWRVDLC